jgi:hypothetical protein
MMQRMAKKLPGSTDAGAETGVECEKLIRVTGSKVLSLAAAKNQRMSRGGGKGVGS